MFTARANVPDFLGLSSDFFSFSSSGTPSSRFTMRPIDRSIKQALEEEIEGLKTELVHSESANDELNVELQLLQEMELAR